MQMVLKLATLLALSPLAAFAAPTIPSGGLSQGFNFDGVLTDSGGAPITASTQIKLRILDPGANCMLFEEDHTVTPGNDGSFSVRVGGGIRTGNDSNYTFARIFQNSNAFGNNPGVCTGYSPLPGDGRRLRVIVGGSVQLTPDFDLAAVPAASVAETLQGRSPIDFIQVNAGNNLNQVTADNIFSATNYPLLTALLGGTSTLYMRSSPSSNVGFNNQRVTDIAAPTSGTDAANKTYVDTVAGSVGGKAIDAIGVGLGTGGGYTLVWDQSANKWVAGIPNDTTKLSLGGGTMAGTINMGNNQLINSGHLFLSPGYTLKFGSFTTTAETGLLGSLSGGDAGRTWYNSDSSKLRLWTGASAVDVAGGGGGITSLTGDVVATGTGSVSSTIANNAVTTPKLFTNPGMNRLVKTNGSTGATLEPFSCAINETIVWTASGWTCSAGLPGIVANNGNAFGTGMLIGTNDAFPVAFKANNTEFMRMLPNGNVGINTTSPARLLHVNGAIRISPLVLPSSPAAGDIAIDSSDANKLKYHNGTSWMTIGTSAGSGDFMADGSVVMTGQLRVPLGSAAAPAYSFATDPDTGMHDLGTNELGLVVGGSISYRFNTTYMSSGNNSGYLIPNGSGSASGPSYSWGVAASTGMFNAGGGANVAFSTLGAERMRILQTGEIGIGTSVPSVQLEVLKGQNAGTVVQVTNNTSGSSAKAALAASNSGAKKVSVSMLSSTYSLGGAYVANGGLLETDGTGGLGISSADTGGLASNIRFYTNGNSAGNERMRIDGSGNVGVGTTAATERFHIVGNLRVQGTTDCTLGNGSGGTSCTSDIRLKRNVTPIQLALAKVISLRGVEFDWNEKSLSEGRHDIGVIAQDVEAVFPSAVMTDTASGFKKVDYAVMVAPLIESVKELNNKLAKAERDNAMLKAYICKQDQFAEFCRN